MATLVSPETSPLIHPALHTVCCLLLAANYFAFQVEMFEEEYERNHRTMSESESFAAPTMTWESFDKNNAPKAFTVKPVLYSEQIRLTEPHAAPETPPFRRTSIIRDKSPPFAA